MACADAVRTGRARLPGQLLHQGLHVRLRQTVQRQQGRAAGIELAVHVGQRRWREFAAAECDESPYGVSDSARLSARSASLACFDKAPELQTCRVGKLPVVEHDHVEVVFGQPQPRMRIGFKQAHPRFIGRLRAGRWRRRPSARKRPQFRQQACKFVGCPRRQFNVRRGVEQDAQRAYRRAVGQVDSRPVGN